MSRWTESRADPVQSIQTKRKYSIRSDDSDDEETPGAYLISRNRPPGQSFVDEWDPTEQIHEDALSIPHEIESARECHVEFLNVDMLLASEETDGARECPANNDRHKILDKDSATTFSKSIFLDDSHAVPNNSDIESTSFKERWYRRKSLILLVVAFIIATISLRVAFIVPKQETGGYEIPLWLGNCEVDNQVKLAKMKWNPLLQCRLCFGKIQAIDEKVTDAYMHLRTSKMFRDHIGDTTDITSCEPENIALFWVAQNLWTENAGSDLSLVPSNRTLSRFVLVLLYASLGGDHWINTRNWLTSDSECNWFGIECDEEARVTSLVLRQNSLTGSLDERLGLLSDLRMLDLAKNVIAGPIPLAVWNLPVLEKLDLHDNLLNGTFMTNSRVDASNLKNLSLKMNSDLKGPFSMLSNMTGLVEVDVSSTGLSGSMPTSVGLLTALKRLILSGTTISGTIPMTIGRMISLEDFFIDNTHLTGTFPTTFGNLENLVSLNANGNTLEGRIPTEIGRCSQLQTFLVAENYLTGAIPSELGKCQQLHLLDLSFNDFINTVPRDFERLPNLEEIRLSCTFISSPLPVGLCNQSTIIEVSGEHQHDSPCSCCKIFQGGSCR